MFVCVCVVCVYVLYDSAVQTACVTNCDVFSGTFRSRVLPLRAIRNAVDHDIMCTNFVSAYASMRDFLREEGALKQLLDDLEQHRLTASRFFPATNEFEELERNQQHIRFLTEEQCRALQDLRNDEGWQLLEGAYLCPACASFERL